MESAGSPVRSFLRLTECRSAVKARYVTSVVFYHSHALLSLRTALSFHAVSFGPDALYISGSLRRMVQIATEIHNAAPGSTRIREGVYGYILSTQT